MQQTNSSRPVSNMSVIVSDDPNDLRIGTNFGNFSNLDFTDNFPRRTKELVVSHPDNACIFSIAWLISRDLGVAMSLSLIHI